MQPESNQQSITSGTRRIVPAQPAAAHGSSTASIHGLWTMRSSDRPGSSAWAARKAAKASGLRASISAQEAGASWWPQTSHSQMLSGVPQKRSRDRAQSTLPARKSPKRPSRMCSGSQVTSWLFSMTWSMTEVVLMNQASRAYWMSGSLSLRQQNGYSWR